MSFVGKILKGEQKKEGNVKERKGKKRKWEAK
jgi:hypothetical protein